jgi:glyoxylase I family protein
MGVGVHGVNHVACLARDMDETVRFYEGFLGIRVRRVVSDTPGQKHYSLDLGGEGTLDFFEAGPGTVASQRNAIGALNHLAITADPEFINLAEEKLSAGSIPVRVVERAQQKTIYFSDPNGINVQLYPSTGGTRG